MSSLLQSTCKLSATQIYNCTLRNGNRVPINRYPVWVNRLIKNHFQTSTRCFSSQPLAKHLRKLDENARTMGLISLQEVEKAFGEIKSSRYASTTQSLLMIRCCGNLIPDEAPNKRTQLVQEIWNTFGDIGIPLDISHYNALLKVYLENEHPFVPTDFLALLKEKGLQPNRVTIQRLITRYCQMADIEAATKLVKFMREQKMPTNEYVFNALILGHSNANDMKSAKDTLNLMKQVGIDPSAESYTILICGYIRQGDLKKVDSLLKRCEETDIFFANKDYLEIAYNLALYNHSVDKIISKMKENAGYNKETINYIYRLLSADRIDGALQILKTTARAAYPEYRESIGHAVLEIVKRVKSKPEVNQQMECILEELLNNKICIGSRSAKAIHDEIHGILTPQMSTSLAKLTDTRASETLSSISNDSPSAHPDETTAYEANHSHDAIPSKRRMFNEDEDLMDDKKLQFDRVVRDLNNNSESISVKDIANTLNTLNRWNALKNEKFQPVIAKLIKLASRKCSEFHATEIAVIMNALSKCDLLNNPKFEGSKSFILRLIEEANKRHGEFKGYEITSILQALSRWTALDSKELQTLFSKLVKECNKKYTEFNSQDIVFTLNALSKWPVLHNQELKTLVCNLIKESNKVYKGFSATDIVLALNALCKWNGIGNANYQEGGKSLRSQGSDLSQWTSDEKQEFRTLVVNLIGESRKVCAEFNSLDISTMFNTLSKLDAFENTFDGSRDLILDLIQEGNRKYTKFNSRDIANILNALCNWNLHDNKQFQTFIDNLITECTEKVDGFNAQQIAMVFNALCKWDIVNNKTYQGGSELVRKLIHVGNRKYTELKCQEIAMICNALCRWPILENAEFRTFVNNLIKVSNKKCAGFNYQGISYTLQALSKWNIPDEEKFPGGTDLIANLIKEGNKKYAQFNSQAIANTLKILSVLKVHRNEKFPGGTELIVNLIGEANKKHAQFKCKDIALIFSSLSKWDILNGREFPGGKTLICNLINESAKKCAQFSAHDIVNTWNALSKWDVLSDKELKDSKDLIVCMVKEATKKYTRFNSQEITNILNALYKLNVFVHPELENMELEKIKSFIGLLTDRKSRS